MARTRVTRKHLVVAIAVGVGLLHFVTGPRYRGPFPAFVNGYLIDILLPFALYLLLAIVHRPFALPRIARASIVLGVGVTVETLQFLGVPIFGRTFDPLDFLMYILGIAGAVFFERAVLSRLPAGGAAAPGRPAPEQVSGQLTKPPP
jgi:hypothetical protein